MALHTLNHYNITDEIINFTTVRPSHGEVSVKHTGGQYYLLASGDTLLWALLAFLIFLAITLYCYFAFIRPFRRLRRFQRMIHRADNNRNEEFQLETIQVLYQHDLKSPASPPLNIPGSSSNEQTTTTDPVNEMLSNPTTSQGKIHTKSFVQKVAQDESSINHDEEHKSPSASSSAEENLDTPLLRLRKKSEKSPTASDEENLNEPLLCKKSDESPPLENADIRPTGRRFSE